MRVFGIGGELLLALDVGGELHQAPIEFGRCGRLARAFLAVERLAGDDEAMQRGAGAGFGFAQAAAERPTKHSPACVEASACAPVRAGDFAHGSVLARCSASATFGIGRQSSADGTASPRPCGPARTPRDSAPPGVAWRLSAFDLGGELADHVFEALQVGFRPRVSRSSASWRRACRPEMPAASSSTRRRCSGFAWMISPMRP